MKVLKSGSQLLFALLLATAISGCSKVSTPGSNAYVPTAADATATATLADLQSGRTLFINNCDRCHNLPVPENYTPAQWRTILPNMTNRAGLSASEITLLTKYVTRGK